MAGDQRSLQGQLSDSRGPGDSTGHGRASESSEGNDSLGRGCSSRSLRSGIPERSLTAWGCQNSPGVEEVICAAATKGKHDQPQHPGSTQDTHQVPERTAECPSPQWPVKRSPGFAQEN